MNGGGRGERDILITVKTYPTPSISYEETVCVAGIDIDSGEWVRLYPLQFRDLPFGQQFRKYEIVRMVVVKHERDPRPESHRPDYNTIRLLRYVQAGRDWEERRAVVEPTSGPSMCAILREHGATGKSLGCFRPKQVMDFIIKDDSPQWTGKQRAAVKQLRLFDAKRKPIEKIPLKFFYKYVCDEARCKGHTQRLLDWEVCQLYRNLRDQGDAPEAIRRKIREKFLDDLCGPRKDTLFFVGNHSAHPNSFMVLGVFYPKRRPPGLFNGLPCTP